jgi:Domain of unknown function (DUF4295)
MAKKVVATFKDKTTKVSITKVIIPVRNEKTGSYSFKEEIVPSDQLPTFLKDNNVK